MARLSLEIEDKDLELTIKSLRFVAQVERAAAGMIHVTETERELGEWKAARLNAVAEAFEKEPVQWER